MSKKILVLLTIMIVTANAFLAGCTTAQSRQRDKRIEELERRVSKIEFDSNDSYSSDSDLSRYRDMARTAR